jgi:hypothetical protein
VISVIEGLLGGAAMYRVTDRSMSVLEGSIGAIELRILVPDGQEIQARDMLIDAELGPGFGYRRQAPPLRGRVSSAASFRAAVSCGKRGCPHRRVQG